MVCHATWWSTLNVQSTDESSLVALKVEHKSPSMFKGSFAAGPHIIHAHTTRKSVTVSHQPVAARDQAAILFSTESKVLHGYNVTETKVLEQTFLTVLSSRNNKVMVESTAEILRPSELKQMYEEASKLHPRIRKANTAYAQAKEGEPPAQLVLPYGSF